ncbi:YdcF family protein [Thermosynechococcaceae cyanobacterium BACA0444]|uniref:YdcF family protein n=1 Tax=Pseudocalidococcus azoricus BACA0444 TaxID=2918990 RepID=A0AAE4FV55_9CYAN|nr:YdcF family protein [Pseudocalidococcus azoricus]MDS3861857.1 YdcF family protein [Pseudocalidococcus azoricus BACA0444]
MELFISKLLPLFAYPLGLACLGLIVAMCCLWKQPRIAAVAIVISFGALFLGGNYVIAQSLTAALEYQNPAPKPLPKAAAIIVLGGGVRSQIPPSPWVDLNDGGDRILYGAKLWREGYAPYLILSGGRVDSTPGVSEAADMAQIAQAMGVPPTAILLEPNSRTTYENAQFTQELLNQQAISGRLLLVTSAWHLPRALGIFRHFKLDVIPAPIDYRSNGTTVLAGLAAIPFYLIPDVEWLSLTTMMLKEYFGLGIYWLRGWL